MKIEHARARNAGFSMVELMMVVVITGILAAVAIPTFTDYIYKSRTGEAVSFLGVIKLKQEAFRSEFGTYSVCGGQTALGATFTDNNAFRPVKDSTSPRNLSIGWGTTAAGDLSCFNALGASPDGPVRFRYAWIAGTPTQFGASGVAAAHGATADHYMVAQGHCDLDDDGTWGVFELTSFTRNVWVGTTGGSDLAAGWE
jgi:prepilin-type N-terminal cleavage/methylation domain-containing protein